MSDESRYALAPGVIVEDLGDDTAVLVPQSTEVLALSGDAAVVLRRIREGESVDGAPGIVSDLVARGVIQPVAGMSRRGLVRAGAIGLGAGILVMTTPTVAAASSPAGGAACVAGQSVNTAQFGPLDNGNRVFSITVALSSTPQGFRPLTVFIDGVAFSGAPKSWEPGTVTSIEWNVARTPDPLTGPVCGNFTIDGVTFQANFTSGSPT